MSNFQNASPLKVTHELLDTHLKTTLSRQELLALQPTEDMYVSTGHNLRIKEQREEYARAYDAERTKIHQVSADIKKWSDKWDKAKTEKERDEIGSQISKKLPEWGKKLQRPAEFETNTLVNLAKRNTSSSGKNKK